MGGILGGILGGIITLIGQLIGSLSGAAVGCMKSASMTLIQSTMTVLGMGVQTIIPSLISGISWIPKIMQGIFPC